MAGFTTTPAPDLARKIHELVRVLDFQYIDAGRLHCIRSRGSRSEAYARIWELPRVWQEALSVPPQYVIEVLAEHFDPLAPREQIKILIHELLHIPKTFSGALRNHRGWGEPINDRTVNTYYRTYARKILDKSFRQMVFDWE